MILSTNYEMKEIINNGKERNILQIYITYILITHIYITDLYIFQIYIYIKS